MCGRGVWGAIAAGLSFIAPAWLIVVALSWGYFRYQQLPQVEAMFIGISPVVIAIVASFALKLGRKSIHRWEDALISMAMFALLALTSINILLLLLGAGLVGLWVFRPKPPNTPPKALTTPVWGIPLLPWLPIYHRVSLVLATSTPDILAAGGLWGLERIGQMFWPLVTLFLKTGSFIFGGGLVIIPLLEFEIVNQLGWLTTTEFVNGVAIGQVSPGPVVLTSAFVGYRVAGVLGALIAAIAIFLPSFVFILFASPVLTRIRHNAWVRAFLQGVTPAVLGAIAAAALPLARAAFVQETVGLSVLTVVLGGMALLLLVRFKRPTWQLVPAGAVVGLLAGVAQI